MQSLVLTRCVSIMLNQEIHKILNRYINKDSVESKSLVSEKGFQRLLKDIEHNKQLGKDFRSHPLKYFAQYEIEIDELHLDELSAAGKSSVHHKVVSHNGPVEHLRNTADQAGLEQNNDKVEQHHSVTNAYNRQTNHSSNEKLSEIAESINSISKNIEHCNIPDVLDELKNLIESHPVLSTLGAIGIFGLSVYMHFRSGSAVSEKIIELNDNVERLGNVLSNKTDSHYRFSEDTVAKMIKDYMHDPSIKEITITDSGGLRYPVELNREKDANIGKILSEINENVKGLSDLSVKGMKGCSETTSLFLRDVQVKNLAEFNALISSGSKELQETYEKATEISQKGISELEVLDIMMNPQENTEKLAGIIENFNKIKFENSEIERQMEWLLNEKDLLQYIGQKVSINEIDKHFDSSFDLDPPKSGNTNPESIGSDDPKTSGDGQDEGGEPAEPMKPSWDDPEAEYDEADIKNIFSNPEANKDAIANILTNFSKEEDGEATLTLPEGDRVLIKDLIEKDPNLNEAVLDGDATPEEYASIFTDLKNGNTESATTITNRIIQENKAQKQGQEPQSGDNGGDNNPEMDPNLPDNDPDGE